MTGTSRFTKCDVRYVTMKQDDTIQRIRKKRTMSLLIILLMQVILYILMCVLARTGFARSENVKVEINRTVLRSTLCLVLLIVASLFYIERIRPLRLLDGKQRQIGRIMDFFLIGYTDGGHRKYRVYPIVKDEREKLYLAYGKYALSSFNTKSTYCNNVLKEIAVCGDNGGLLQIGDEVGIYVLKELNIPVSVCAENETIMLNGKKYPYLHIDNNFGIEKIEEITFFQGVISEAYDRRT